MSIKQAYLNQGNHNWDTAHSSSDLSTINDIILITLIKLVEKIWSDYNLKFRHDNRTLL